jgi:hypothetical protein
MPLFSKDLGIDLGTMYTRVAEGRQMVGGRADRSSDCCRRAKDGRLGHRGAKYATAEYPNPSR